MLAILNRAAPAAPHWLVDWDALQVYPWMEPLHRCPQDPIHHAEGNVWIHTRMVLEALAEDLRFRALPADRRTVLFAAAVLHDVAKPLTTVTEPNGRITARGHSSLGAIMAREILWRMGFPFHLREQVCGLIRHHQTPFYLIDRPDAQRLATSISQVCKCEELSVLADADIRGRICQDAERIFQNIALFKEFCAEEGCLDQARPFSSGHSRVEYFRHEQRAPDYAAYDDTVVEAIVMSGLPGAGKDTWISANASHLPVVSLDVLREEMDVDPSENQGTVVQAARERAREFLRRRQSFVWNATNVSRMMRSQILRLLYDYHARVRLVYVEAPAATLFAQNSSRERIVPPAVIEKLLRRWDVPDATEAHTVEYVISGE
jgi:predicted kinase